MNTAPPQAADGTDKLSAAGTPLRTAPDEQAAVEDLHALGCTDGLPVIVPTPQRVARIVLAGGLAPELSLGGIGPLDGDATVEAVAACAVMAGCLPDHFPVVLAAVRALCDPVLDMDEVQVTTHGAGPMLIVNGPARDDCGPFASGTGVLGPGHRANAAVGRAVRLCLLNIGGGRPGVGDMALFGQPGKYTCCLAEAQEESPFAPLHVRLGFAAADSVVTVVNVDAPISVMVMLGEGRDADADRLIRQLAAAVANPASNNIHLGSGEIVVILNPEHAQALAAAGYTPQTLAQAISAGTETPREHLLAIAYPDRGRPGGVARIAAEQLMIVVAGGGGVYSQVLPSWGAGTHRNRHVSVPIRYGEACEIPVRGVV